jgi:hypothetical protein
VFIPLLMIKCVWFAGIIAGDALPCCPGRCDAVCASAVCLNLLQRLDEKSRDLAHSIRVSNRVYWR